MSSGKTMGALVHEVSSSIYSGTLTGTNDWEITAEALVGGYRALDRNFTLAVVDGSGVVYATTTVTVTGSLYALKPISVTASGLAPGAYYVVLSFLKGSGSNESFMILRDWEMRIRELVPTAEAVVNSSSFLGQEGYRFGFNGMEKDDEMKGVGNSINYKARIYDPRLGKFLSIDPLTEDFSWYTPYQFAGNKPIWAIDLDGLEEFIVTDYFNAAGELYETKIKMVSTAGITEGRQVVHRQEVRVNQKGEATMRYLYSKRGTTTGSTARGDNAFNTDAEKEFALGINPDGSTKVNRLFQPFSLYPNAAGYSETPSIFGGFQTGFHDEEGETIFIESAGDTKDFNAFTSGDNVRFSGGKPDNMPNIPGGENVIPNVSSQRTNENGNPPADGTIGSNGGAIGADGDGTTKTFTPERTNNQN